MSVRMSSYSVHRVAEGDVRTLRDLLAVFGEAFDDPATYGDAQPDDAYLTRLLARRDFVAIVATVDGEVVAGLAAYVLEKFEQPRSEIYIYDLAVAERHRRRGIATACIDELRKVAREIGAYVIYVQADTVDEPAIALYESIGVRESVLHFDIEP